MSKTKHKKKAAPESARRASPIERIDAEIAAEVGRFHDHPIVRSIGGASELADQPPLIAICAATAAAGLLLKRPALARTGVRMLASELVATAFKHVIKRRVDRTRPHKMLDEGRYKLSHEGKNASEEGPWSSFPSGHTAGAVAVARAIAHERPGAALPAALAAGTVALVQLPRRKHFVTDVLAGVAIGFAAEAVAGVAMRLASRVSLPVRTGSGGGADRLPPAAA